MRLLAQTRVKVHRSRAGTLGRGRIGVSSKVRRVLGPEEDPFWVGEVPMLINPIFASIDFRGVRAE